jgi:hypothetical protein
MGSFALIYFSSDCSSLSTISYEISEKVQKSLITLIRADYTDMKCIEKSGKSV